MSYVFDAFSYLFYVNRFSELLVWLSTKDLLFATRFSGMGIAALT